MNGGIYNLGARTKEAAWRLAFYEWAYGRLGEMDDGLGPIGEFLVGLRVGGVDTPRREKAPVDLVGKDGTTYEVKTTGRPREDGVHRPRRTWTVRDEADALEGRAPLADRWLFLIADFPVQAALIRAFDPFNPRWWTVQALTGLQMRASGVRYLATDGTLRKAGAVRISLDELGPPPPNDPVGLRLAFFRWAYGDLAAPFNFGRLAEFQVMRACGRVSLARRSWGAVDLVSRGRGLKLEVKTCCRPGHQKDGTPFYTFAVPARRVAPLPGAEKKRQANT